MRRRIGFAKNWRSAIGAKATARLAARLAGRRMETRFALQEIKGILRHHDK